MKIAQIAPLFESVPPQTYGGSQRVISLLTEGLFQNGHEVTLFAPGTSKTAAKLISVYPRPLYRDNIPRDSIHYPLLNLTAAIEKEAEFDILHFHLDVSSDYLALPLTRMIKNKVVFTLHFTYPTNKGPAYYERHIVLQKFKDMNFVSLSNAQRKGGENLNWVATVYNGINPDIYTLHEKPKDYLVWVGKFNPDKGVEDAIKAAKQTGMKLVLAGTVDPLNKEDYLYFTNLIKPQIDGKQIQYIGEVTDTQKNDLFGNALAFLNPLKWNEPFGLTMVEALATGCPVIAYDRGAAPEIIRNGHDGFVVSDLTGMIQALGNIKKINREVCRGRVQNSFSAAQMVVGYESVYRLVLA